MHVIRIIYEQKNTDEKTYTGHDNASGNYHSVATG
jgi:hypothetical protein